jgi:hypothetical protein
MCKVFNNSQRGVIAYQEGAEVIFAEEVSGTFVLSLAMYSDSRGLRRVFYMTNIVKLGAEAKYKLHLKKWRTN